MAARGLQHRLDRRAAMLGERLRREIDLTAQMLRPPGGMPAFTTQLTNTEALDFWKRHRFDRIGAQVLSGWTPEQIAELDAWLAAEQEPPESEPMILPPEGL